MNMDGVSGWDNKDDGVSGYVQIYIHQTGLI